MRPKIMSGVITVVITRTVKRAANSALGNVEQELVQIFNTAADGMRLLTRTSILFGQTRLFLRCQKPLGSRTRERSAMRSSVVTCVRHAIVR